MIYNVLEDVEIVKKRGVYYLNCPCAFDIETSSFYQGPEKKGIMYLWSMDINGLCFYGRTWKEFINICTRLSTMLELGSDLQLIIYVHNLAFEFQWFRKYFTWEKVFARKKRKTMQCLTDNGLLFKCSYFLSGYSLEKVADNLHLYNIKKLKGNLDYSKIRHSGTLLTNEELEYSLNDVLIIEYFIREEIERNGNIAEIPLTQTGYVRKLISSYCYPKKDKRAQRKFRELKSSLTLDSEEYKQLKRAYQGGFTHANAFYNSVKVKEVSSIDFNSSYPAIMVNEKFPMSSAIEIEIESEKQFYELMENYCCIFDIEFTNIGAINICEHPISSSKCWNKEGVQEDNGRVVEARKLATTLTEVDFSYLKYFYEWDEIRISNFRYYIKGYLPTPIVTGILDLYESKTKLKNVEGKEIEYLHSKELINSCYGMMVTDIAPEEIIYSDDWISKDSEIDECIDKYNRKARRFLFYPWGVYVTAYARRNLFTGIHEFETDYIYSDTDSIKCKNYNNHMVYINQYNEQCLLKNRLAMAHHNMSESRTCPEDSKGRKRHLGVWDYEGTYDEFMTLGAKRYMYIENGKVHITVAGVHKTKGAEYIQMLSERYKKDPFSFFNFDLIIPAEYSGKGILSYIDDEISGKVTDYLGKEGEYHESSSIHFEKGEYNFNISQQYIDYLFGLTYNN